MPTSTTDIEQLKKDYKHVFTTEFLNSDKFIEIMTTESYEVSEAVANEIRAIQQSKKPQFERSKAISQLLRDKCPESFHPYKTRSKAA